MDTTVLAMGVSLFGAIVLVVIYAHQRLTVVDRAVEERVLVGRSEAVVSRSALRAQRRSALPVVDLLPVSPAARERMEHDLGRAGIPLAVTEYLALRAGCAVAGSVVGFAVGQQLGNTWLTVGMAIGLLLAGWFAPRWWVDRSCEARMQRLDAQVADALAMIAKSLRAGSGVTQALAYAAENTPEPLGPEIETTLRELRLGLEAEEAFRRLSERVGSADLDIAVTAILIQRSVGGNLSEILTNVVTTIRERTKLHREVEVITSRQKLMGTLMALVPVLIAVAFMTLNPDVGGLLVDTVPGRIALAIGIAFEVFGLFLIRRFARVEV